MLIDLILYRIGEPTVPEANAFWIYTDLSKEDLALSMYALMERGFQINVHNLISVIRCIGAHAEPLNDTTLPVKDIDSRMN